ncbi:MAG: hypothetical protein HW421_1925 [Ignavibacteria bacterium]|nr:hypothetical protein [Ignavibacteria bacterium]
MKAIMSLSLIILFVLSSQFAFGQTAAPFLTICPSPENNALGSAGVSLPLNNAFSIYHNPAFSSFGANERNFSFDYNLTDKEISIPIDNTQKIAAVAGIDLSKFYKDLPISVGIGYLRQSVDLGEFIRTDLSGKIIGKFHGEEWANTLNLSTSIDCWVKIGIGMNIKFVNSDLGPGAQGNTNAFDFGFFMNAPILKESKLIDGYPVDFNFGLGYSLSNFGDELTIRSMSDPLPRTSTLGYSLSGSIKHQINKSDFKILELQWTAEASDILASRLPPISTTKYKSAFENINIWDNILLLKNDNISAVRYGIKVGIFETLSFAFGRNNQDTSINVAFDSYGISFQTDGLVKYLSDATDIELLKFIRKYLILKYSYSKITNSRESNNYSKTFSYHGLGLAVKLFD